jgi:hypothetical protein
MHRIRILDQDEGARNSTEFLRRYRRLYISDQVAEAILNLARDWQVDKCSAAAEFARKRQRWESQGGFLDMLSVEEISGWIRSSSYIVAEAAPLATTESDLFIPVAQRVYRLPEDDWIIPLLLEPEDTILDPDLHREVLSAGPRSTGIADYGGVVPEWAASKLAGAARYAGALEVIRRNIDRSRNSQVRFMASFIFAIQGLEVFGAEEREQFGAVIRLASFNQDEIVNHVSLATNMGSKRVPMRLVGIWRTAPPVPVLVHGKSYALKVHWHYMVLRLEDVRLSQS